jgi:hypothetical protein
MNDGLEAVIEKNENFCEKHTWETYLKEMPCTGIVNKLMIKGYGHLRKKRMPVFVDHVLQAFFGGAMTRDDQETFAKVADKEAWKLTIQNSILTVLMSPQYYGMVKGVEYLNSNLDDGSLNAVGYGASALVAGGNLIRMGLAYKNKKAYAAFSNDGLLFNSTTYIKKFGDFIKR